MKAGDIFTYQDLAVYWLLFIGYKKKEVVNFKSENIVNWQDNYREGIVLPIEIQNKVTEILKKADGGPRKYKNKEFLIRSAKGKKDELGKPVTDNVINPIYKRLKNHLNRPTLGEVNIRKSGMLYFGYEILKSIECNIDSEEIYIGNDILESKVYDPIRITFGENLENYKTSLNDIFKSNALYEFYHKKLNTKRKENASSDFFNVSAANSKTPIKPPERNFEDETSWKQNIKHGAIGEFIILEHLKKEFKELCLAKDGIEYDIYAKNENEIRCIEVKTMKNESCQITITKNEYEVAHLEGYVNHHWFYIVLWDNTSKDKEPAKLYIFKDLLGIIGLRDKKDIIFIEKTIPIDTKTLWTHNDFSIKLSEEIFDKNDGCIIISYAFIDKVKETYKDKLSKILTL